MLTLVHSECFPAKFEKMSSKIPAGHLGRKKGLAERNRGPSPSSSHLPGTKPSQDAEGVRAGCPGAEILA